MAKLLELEGTSKMLIDNAGSFSVFDPFANSRRTIGQRAIALILRPLMLAVASGKSTHWFDYQDLEAPEYYEGLRIPGDYKAFDIGHPDIILRRLRHVHMSLGGWKETVLIGPDPGRANAERLGKTGWLYGFRVLGPEGTVLKSQYSRLLNPGFTSILILRGPREFDAIGLDPETLDEIPLAGMRLIRRGINIQ